jgi:hypothetical protein
MGFGKIAIKILKKDKKASSDGTPTVTDDVQRVIDIVNDLVDANTTGWSFKKIKKMKHRVYIVKSLDTYIPELGRRMTWRNFRLRGQKPESNNGYDSWFDTKSKTIFVNHTGRNLSLKRVAKLYLKTVMYAVGYQDGKEMSETYSSLLLDLYVRMGWKS